MVQEESTRGVVNLSKDVANFLPPLFFNRYNNTEQLEKKKRSK